MNEVDLSRGVSAGTSKGSVFAAIAGNTLVMAAKFVAWSMTGSGAMLSEAIHTAADVMNQVLLMIGIVRSERAADEEHAYGYGRERYVWALMSAVGIFFLGCGVTIYHGVNALIHPHPIGAIGWAIGVLLFALVVEGSVLSLAYRGLAASARAAGKPFGEFIWTDADPTAMAVLLEDAAACLGVLIAMACIGLASWTGNPIFDAIGSILIGVLLGAVAIWLIARNRQLLVGQQVPPEARARIRQVIASRPLVAELIEVKSRVIDTETYDVLLTLEFDSERITTRLEPRLRAAWEKIDGWESFRDFAEGYTDELCELLGDTVDSIETAIREQVPEAKHIDIELN